MNIIIFGPQGSGKGTQAEILAVKKHIPHISTGDIFRELKHQNTDIAKQVAKLIDNGTLAPDDLTNKIVVEPLTQADTKNGFILDGFPRNIIQAEFLNNITSIDFALEIFIQDDEALKRISKRRSCPKCGKIYHREFSPPENEGKCDDCHAKLIIRKDDQPEAIKKRLATYHEQTEPLIKYYQEKKIYHKIDGSPSIEDVSQGILQII